MLWQSHEEHRHGLADRSAGRVDYDVLAIPRAVVAGNNVLPRGPAQFTRVSQSPFDPATVFLRVGTPDFNFDGEGVGAAGRIEPRVARDGKWIDRIGDHDSADTQVVFRERICHAIPGIVEESGGDAGFTDGSFNGIDTDVHGAKSPRELAGYGGLAGAWQTAESDQHYWRQCISAREERDSDILRELRALRDSVISRPSKSWQRP